MKLSGKTVLVTGSSQGIGQAIALRMAQEGADVVVNYHSHPGEADDVKAQIEGLGRRAVAIGADLGSVSSVNQLIADGVTAFGKLDILVNNAGVEKNAAFWDVTEKDYDFVLNTNLKGPFFATQAFVKYLQGRKSPGKIINISSVHEDLPFPHFTAYCASKGGLKMMTRNLSIELAPLGITINNIAPGAIETPINTALLHDPAKLNALLQNIPLQRLGQPGDISSAVAFLASPEADYITGTTLVIDGGLTWNYSEQ
ncbi:MAG: glucose 1-dehydrogenase [Methylacidiphilales bacterium]|nr:glucose 1-dehydrogenase [Candidatus Methylacidiphilales bacterium]